MAKKNIFILMFAILSGLLFSQEALKSIEEEYYDYLSLEGITERPVLNYRTLSDSKWGDNENIKNTVWHNNNLGSIYFLYDSENKSENWFLDGFNQSIILKIYGPEWFNSYNTASPYGQNDGVLWQGKGYNSSFTGGIRLEGYGFELTLKPQVVFSQNNSFDYIKPNYSQGKPAGKYGYYGVGSIDAPQRFGELSFWDFSWGDTEARFIWKSFTAGFGFQSIWLGPSKLNPIIHSNNAPGYPKFDIGLRKTHLIMPFLHWDLGYLEARGWWGCLSESDFFDNDSANNNNLISGLAIAWQAPFLEQLTIGFNRTMLSKWDDISAYTLFDIFIPGLSTDGGVDASDQRASIIVDYLLKDVGFEVYFEWAKNDYSPSLMHYIRYPFHTQAWTIGMRQAFDLPFNLKGKLNIEFTHLETSADYDRIIEWYTTFYAHHKVTQGYTNGGQWLGAGIGTGGNSQYLDFSVLYPSGNISFFIQRRNPDLDYTMYIDAKRATGKNPTKTRGQVEIGIRTNLDFGILWTQFINRNIRINSKYVFNWEINPLNEPYQKRYNNHFELSMKYNF